MARVIDQIRASKLPSSMMQFAARGALQVPAAENIEILVHLALHNKVFGELARMTLAGWDEKACRAAAADPQTSRQVLDYFIAPDNLRPALLPALLENPAIPEEQLAKLAGSAMRETIEAMLKSARIQSLPSVLKALQRNPYLKKEESLIIDKLRGSSTPSAASPVAGEAPKTELAESVTTPEGAAPEEDPEEPEASVEHANPESDEDVAAYLKEHAHEIVAEGEKPFQAVGGVVELLGPDYFPVTQEADLTKPDPAAVPAAPGADKKPRVAPPKKRQPDSDGKRENTLQKIKNMDVKGRIQLALKGNKEERSILIRDGTKVVALAVLEAPKLSDGEVERFASQKNVLEAVLRQIPLKRRFMKNYIVVRNLVANPRTPLDIGLGLMKNLLAQDLKNIANNKDVSETIRKLALKMYKQKMESANKK